jgi:pimeloyl-ACP methyl ester carboxylesterase
MNEFTKKCQLQKQLFVCATPNACKTLILHSLTQQKLDHTASMIEFIESNLKWREYGVFGHSMGADVALILSYMKPNHVKFFVSFDSL